MAVLDDYVGLIEAAELLGIHFNTVRRLIKQGDIPATKFAGSWMINGQMLAQFKANYDPRPGAKQMPLLV